VSCCYREGFGGKRALNGLQKMYKNHSQLLRFKQTMNPKVYLSYYLNNVLNEAKTRNLDWAIQSTSNWFSEDYKQSLSVTEGQN